MHFQAVNYSPVLFIPILKLRDTFSGSSLQPPKCGNYFEKSKWQESDKINLPHWISLLNKDNNLDQIIKTSRHLTPWLSINLLQDNCMFVPSIKGCLPPELDTGTQILQAVQ